MLKGGAGQGRTPETSWGRGKQGLSVPLWGPILSSRHWDHPDLWALGGVKVRFTLSPPECSLMGQMARRGKRELLEGGRGAHLKKQTSASYLGQKEGRAWGLDWVEWDRKGVSRVY